MDFFLKKKVTTLMFFLAVCLCGLISVSRLKVQLLPDIEFSKLSIITTYENAAPSEVEKLITRKIEESITSVNGIQTIYSESMEGVSVVTAQFQWDTNMDVALIEAKEKVDVIKSQLPQDAGKSVVVKFDPKSDPVMLFAIVNKKSDSGNMRHRIEKEIIPFIERIDGVAVVDVSGGLRKQINVNLDAGRLFAYSLTVDEVMQNIASSNHSFPAGYVRNGEMEYLVRTSGEFENFRDIRDVVVGKSEKGVSIVLESIAEVDDGFKDVKCINRFNGKDSIGISIRKEPGKNVVDLSSSVSKEIDNIKPKYSEDFEIVKIYDQSDFVSNSIGNVSREAIVGGLISILVLFFFLRELKAPLIIISSIPISLLGTFSLMYFKGTSLNAMSLGGLAIGIGMIVDSGTIVIESIIESVGRKKHSNIIKPVSDGTRRIAGPVFVSTMSNIIVFLPIVFISGLSGAVFGELALTITFSLLFAFLASVTLIPMLYTIDYSRVAAKFKWSTDNVHVNRVKSFSERFIFKADLIYEKFLGYALDNSRKIIKLGAFVTLIGFFLFLFIDFELMPKVNAGEFNIEIQLPKGSSIENSSLFTAYVENILLSKKYIKYVYSKVGSDPEENIVERTSGKSSNDVSIHVILDPSRFKKTSKIISELKNEIKASKDVKIEYNVKEDVISSILSQKQKALTVNIYGEEPELLKEYGALLSEKLSSIEGVDGLVSSIDDGYPEYKVEIDRDKMSAFGVSVENLGVALYDAVSGEVVSKLRLPDEEIDIRTRLSKEDRSNKESLYKIIVKSDSGVAVPIGNFIRISEGIGPNKIIRSNQHRVNILSADISGNKKKIYKKAEKILSSFPFRENYFAKLVGESDEINKSLTDLFFALLLSVVLIYMLLASQFQSLITPVILMLSIPVSGFGVSAALLITGKTLNINTCIGIILLAGNVVNNSIILYDIIEKEISSSRNIRSAVISACKTRLSAILNTTATTILGMIPLSLGIGEGAEVQQSLAIAVIGGLTVSTFLTLIFIPTVFYLLKQRKKEASSRA